MGGGYYVLFNNFMNRDWPSFINGTHLWYLPMLFVCCMILSSKIYLKKYSDIVIWVSWIAMILAYKMTGFRTFVEVFCYLPVMSLGYFCNENSEGKITFRTLCFHCITLLVFLLIFYLIGLYRLKIVNIVEYLIIGFSAYWIMSKVRHTDKECGKCMNVISNNSFAIYLIHQFVINILLVLIVFNAINFYISAFIIFLAALIMPIGVSKLYNKIRTKWIKF